MHEQTLAHPQSRLREERVVRSGEHLGRAARRRPVERIRHGHRGALVQRDHLRLTAPADDRHHAVALLEAEDGVANAHHLPRQLEPGNVLRVARRCWIAAVFLHDVGAVEPGRLHRNEYLALARNGVRTAHHLQVSVFHHDRLHAAACYAQWRVTADQPFRVRGDLGLVAPLSGEIVA